MTHGTLAHGFLLALAALVVRGLVIPLHPELTLQQTVILAVTCVVCLGPSLTRLCHGVDVLDTPGRRRRHAAAMALAGALFIQQIALTS